MKVSIHINKLTEVQLEGSTHTQEFAEGVTKSPLRFSFQDGQVEALCSEVSEPAWVLNFKRGVLSTFQSSMTRPGHQDLQETDISGTCITHYKSTMEGDVMTIDKVKDLSSCTHRPDLSTYITGTTYISDSPIQSLPIFDSTNNCHQIIQQGILNTAECHESHKFRPFSSEEGGAITTVKTNMVLVSSDQPAVPPTNSEFVRKSAVYEETKEVPTLIEEVNQVLADLEEASHEDIRPSVPVLFSKLVASLKPLDNQALSDLYFNTRQTHSRKFLVDAMPLVQTAASMGVMKTMYVNGDITPTEADIWFTSLAFFKNPTSDMFTVIAPFVDEIPRQQALLGASALVNTYCKLHSQCEADAGVQQVLRAIEKHLGSSCRIINTPEHNNKMLILTALKALGNAGHWVNANQVLRQCYTEENDMEVRVAAIEAWRHTPCEYDRSHLLAAFQDETQDTEVRIAAYLAVMTCPTENVLNTIKDRLTSEAVNQVGSFVWTHLTNMQESAAPGKQWFRQIIGEDLLHNKFNTNALKYSRNFETSFFTNELNAGASVDSNVIFSSKSYLPRSAMLNLTLDLFGESVNLFEVGGRIQGFESYIEHFFGPAGYFPQEAVEGVLKNLHQTKPDPEATTLEGFLDNITDEPEGSYYLRVLGKEIHYNHFNDLNDIFQTSNPLDLIMELVRQGDIDYTKSFQLIDSSYSIPTVSGFPVTLNAKGTATLALRMNGNLNANSLTNFNIEGHLHPSAAIHMDGVMMVDAHVTRKGLQISSTLHTSTFLDGKIHINGGKLVDVAINTPKEKVEVIDVSTKFFIVEDENLVEKHPETNDMIQCTRDIIGMKLCQEMNYLTFADYYSVPYGGRIYLSKTDSQTGYIFQYAMKNNGVSLMIDSPGSEVDHKISLDIKKEDHGATFNVLTPWKSIEGKAEYELLADKKNLNINLRFDGSENYAFSTELLCSRGDEMKVEQTLVVSCPRGELINAKGSVTHIPAVNKYTVDIEETKIFASPLIFRASVGSDERNMEGNMELKSPLLNLKVNEVLTFSQTSISITTNIDYQDVNGRHTIDSTGLVKQEVSNEITTTTLEVKVQPNTWTPEPITLDYQLISSMGHFETTGKLVYGAEYTVEFAEDWTYTQNEDILELKNHATVSIPKYDIDIKSSHEFRLTHNELYINSKQQRNSEPETQATIEAKWDLEREIMLRLYTTTPEIASTQASFNKIAAGHYKIAASTNVGGKDVVMLEGSLLNNNSTPGEINTKVDFSLRSPIKTLQFNDFSLRSPIKTLQFNTEIFGDSEKAKLQMTSNLDGQNYQMVMEGTRTSLFVDTNLYKHILVNAYIRDAGLEQEMLVSVEWEKDIDPTKSIVIQGKIEPLAAEAVAKFLGREVSMKGKLLRNGAELGAQWAPNKILNIDIHFELNETKTLSATVETPFPGWEKQDVSVTLSATQNNLNARAVANWKNSEQMSLTISANLQPGFPENALSANILFSSTLNDLERLAFTLDHKMTTATINTNMEATWNDKKINGVINVTPSDNGIDASASFTSPFTQEALITLHYELNGNQLSTSLESKYGTYVSNITLAGHITLDQTHDVLLTLKVFTPLPFIPEMEANLKYTLDTTILAVVAEGNIGDNKMMLNINGEKTVNDNTTSITGDIRFITPFTYPLTANLSHNYDGQQFTSKFEMTRLWSSYGSLKFNADGHFISNNDIHIAANMDTPDNIGAFSFTHKIGNNHLTTAAKANVNGERIVVGLSGTLDAALSVVNLEGNINSNFNGLDDIKINLSSQKDESGRMSKIILSKGTESVIINHNITYTDMYNWVNSFRINDRYVVKNTQTHSGTVYDHVVRIQWDEQTISVKGTFDCNDSGPWKVFKSQLALETPWRPFENINASLDLQRNAEEVRANVALAYAQGYITELKTSNKILHDSFTSEATLSKTGWDTMGYHFNVELPRKTATLILRQADIEATTTLAGNWEHGKINGNLKFESTVLAEPVVIEGAVDVISTEKTFNLAVTTYTNEKYQITGHFSGDITNANFSLMSELPVERFHHVELRADYKITSFPITFNTELKIDSQNYKGNGQINTNGFQLQMNVNGGIGSVAGDWHYQTTKANAHLQIELPFIGVQNAEASIAYDFESENKINAKVTYNNKQISFSGKLENMTLTIEATTPFNNWETLNGVFFISSSAVNASLSRNDWKIEVTGTLHLTDNKGNGELTITTPFEGHQTISLEVIYLMEDNTKTIQIRSLHNNAEMSVKGVVNISNLQAPEMTLNILTPFPNIKSLKAKANWNVTNPMKTAEVKINHDDNMYHWRLEATTDSLLKGHISTKMSTPLNGFNDVSFKCNFDFTSMPYKTASEYVQDGVVSKLESTVSVTENTIQGNIITPITGWEEININGEYNLQQTQLTGHLEVNKGAQVYDVKGDVLFNTQTPKLNLEVKTPIPQFANTQLKMESNLVDTVKKFHIIFTNNDVTYSADFNGQFTQKVGNTKMIITSPIPGFTELQIDAEYNFTGDVKVAELIVKKEGQTQHFSLTSRINNNNIILDIITPFQDFEVMKLNADYSAEPGLHNVVATFVRDSNVYDFRTTVTLGDTSAQIKLITPIEAIKTVVVSGMYDISEGGVSASAKFHRNDELFEINTRYQFTPLASQFVIGIETPIAGWTTLGLTLTYDFASEKKTVEIAIEKNAIVKKIAYEGFYNLERGYSKLTTPIPGFETMDAEYVLSVDPNNNRLEALVKCSQNDQGWTFSASGHYRANEIVVRLETPFPDFEIMSIEGNIDAGTKTGKGVARIGSYTASINASYAPDNMFVELATPYAPLKFFSVSFKYNFISNGMDATLNATHNTNSYILHGTFHVSPRTSDLYIEATTPIPHLNKLSFQAKYDLDNMRQLVFGQTVIGEDVYIFSMGGGVEEKIAVLRVEVSTPCNGWTDVTFQTKIDLANEDKMLEISLERDGNVREIAIHGKFIGDTLNFDLRTPFAGFQHLSVSGSHNRAKRSLEFQMMNDAGEASIMASFNSFQLHVKTPFERFEEITWEVTKERDGVYKGEWRRNDNYVSLNIQREGRRNAFNVEISSEVNGWEFLGLTGRLDTDIYEAFLSGQRNERKVEISVTGKHDISSRFDVTIKTPYDNYSEVGGVIKYNRRRKTIDVNITSNSSNFKAILKFSGKGLQAELFVPNEQEPTVLNVNITAMNGIIEFSSRFDLLRSYKEAYNVETESSTFQLTHTIEINGVEVLSQEFMANPSDDMIHLEIHVRRGGRHTTIHIHKEAFSTATFLFKREMGGVEKEIKVEMTGQGELPTFGTMHFDIHNSFPAHPRHTTVHVEVDRRQVRKNVKIDITLPGRKLYSININYEISLRNMSHGDYTIGITTPTRDNAIWKNISGNWNLENTDQAAMTLNIGRLTYTATGKLGLLESDLILRAAGVAEDIYLQWRFLRNGDHRDYYLKAGRASRYGLLMLKGTIPNITNGDIEAKIKLPAPFQNEEFHCTSQWKRNSDGTIEASGDFNKGRVSGTHHFQYQRNAAERKGKLNLRITSNDPDFRLIEANVNYDVNRKLQGEVDIRVNDDINRINVDISNLALTRSRNTVDAELPTFLGRSGSLALTLEHDLSNNNNKYINAIARVGAREASLRSNWKRTSNFEQLEGKIEIQTLNYGAITISGKYDMSDLSNASVEAHYKRVTPSGEEKTGNIVWHRLKTDTHLESEVLLDSTLHFLSHVRAGLNVDFAEGFHINSALEWNEKAVNVDINIANNSVTGQITTPFTGFESMTGLITYSLAGRDKTVTLKAERGERKIDMTLTFAKKKGKRSLSLHLTTPYEVLRELNVEGNWNKQRATVTYSRNGQVVNLTGKAQLEASRSEFNFTFTTPQGKNIKVAGAYNVRDILRGQGSQPQKIAGFDLEVDDLDISMAVNGFRNDERVFAEIEGHSSLLGVNNFHLKLNSELNTQNRNGIFELTLNEFVFNIENQFERYQDNQGYYFRSKIESSLTPLPALVFGFGRKNDERIITVGYGEDKEITFSIKAKNHFLNGFSGFVDIPNFGYEGVKYEVDYKFSDDNTLVVELEAELGRDGQEVEAELVYNSDGVKARLSSPFTGRHSVRARRSISSDSFFSEIAYNDYKMSLRGGFQDDDIKRGAVLEGEVFGHKFLIDTLFQSEGINYSEGKLIIQTPFVGMEKMGGLFKISKQNLAFKAEAEVLLPFLNVPKITLDINLNQSEGIHGHIKTNILGQQIILRSDMDGHSLSQGLNGRVEIFTPFHYFSHVSLEGTIKTNMYDHLKAELKIVEPHTSHDLNIEYQLSQNKLSAEFSLASPTCASTDFEFTLEGFQAAHKKVEIRLGTNKLEAEYEISNSEFSFNVNSIYNNIPHQLSIEAHYPSINNLSGTLIATIQGVKNKINGELNIDGNHILGNVELESSLIEGERKLSFDLLIPTRSLRHGNIDFVFTTNVTHKFHCKVDFRSSVLVEVEVNTPLVQNFNAAFSLSGGSAELEIETPTATHNVSVNWRTTAKMPPSYMATVAAHSPLLRQPISFNILLDGGQVERLVKAVLKIGEVEHSMKGKVYFREDATGFSLNIETPFHQINKVVLEAGVQMGEIIKMHTIANFAEKENTFNVEYDTSRNSFKAVAKSPFLPTGQANVEATFTGSFDDFVISIAFMNARDTFSGRFTRKGNNINNNFTAKFELATPIPEFERVNGLFKYTNDEFINIIVSLDNPIPFRANAKFSNLEEEIKGNLTVNTSIRDWEFLEADFGVPLTEFAPHATLTLPGHKYGIAADYDSDLFSHKASLDLYLDDEIHNGSFALRNKAPYELGFVLDQCARFHLRTDSSFFVMLM
ncbi:hypothetical protein Pcinc_032352 [Petrolisthes cinctipes]|uniref:Vitellogenin domain-containing protein n=1 Tax=Petrolisthes cinctipes TaxID=88211 RepID=A0AAE1EUM2_PETCI|nr:hypothetical protein Pcinc_032352 [Petrolisthes cinctipes]